MLLKPKKQYQKIQKNSTKTPRKNKKTKANTMIPKTNSCLNSPNSFLSSINQKNKNPKISLQFIKQKPQKHLNINIYAN
jgi:hypothetical protein